MLIVSVGNPSLLGNTICLIGGNDDTIFYSLMIALAVPAAGSVLLSSCGESFLVILTLSSCVVQEDFNKHILS